MQGKGNRNVRGFGTLLWALFLLTVIIAVIIIITIIIRWTPVASRTVAVALLRRPSRLRVVSDKRLIRWLMTVIKDMTLRRG